MTPTHRLLIFLGVVAVLTAQEAPQAQAQSVFLRNVTVIDGTGAPAQPGMTVVITGNRIAEIGRNVRVAQQAQVVDATGKFVIPGLWDMHLHLRGPSGIPRYTTFGEALLVAHGVTGVRVMAGLPPFHQMRQAVASGDAWGPRIEISSRNMDGAIPRQPLPPKLGDTAGEAEEWAVGGYW